MNTTLVAEALRALANALETPAASPQPAPAQAPTEPTAKRGRGRPVRAEEAPIAAPAPANEADPFAPAVPAATAVPTATLDEVRTALKALQAASTQANALSVLKTAGGVDNLSGLPQALYGAVAAAAKAAIPAAKPVVEADPFETAPAQTAPVTPVPAAKPLTIEEVKAAVVAAQKKAGTELAQKIVMEHGGKAPKDGGGYGPSLKALPPENFAACVAALGNVPTTK